MPSFENSVRNNVPYLNNKTITIGDVRILFTTLFSDIPTIEAPFIEGMVADFHRSKYEEDSLKTLSITEFQQCYRACFEYLQSRLCKPFAGKTIVVSHFAPDFKKWIKDCPIFPFDL